MWFRSPIVWAFAIGLVLAGCGPDRQSGGGEDLDACGGYVEYEALEQPVPDDRRDVSEFADVFLRILSRVELERRVTNADDKVVEVREEVSRAYRALEDSVREFGDHVREGDLDPAGVRTAVAEFAENEAFVAADRTIAEFYTATCSRGNYPTQ